MSLDGTSNTFLPYTINGISGVATSADIANCVKYSGNTSNTDLGTYNLLTTGNITSQQFSIPANAINNNNQDSYIYTASTLGLSTIGGLIFQNAGNQFRFAENHLVIPFINLTQATASKVLTTDASNMITSSATDASQLQYITLLTSQAGGLGQTNTWTGTNTYQNNVSTLGGWTTDLNGVIQTNLNSLGFSSSSFTTTGITGSYSPPLGTLTFISGTTYQIAQTANGQSVMKISGFTPATLTTYYFSINIKCTVGTASLYVEQNNSLRSPTAYQLSTSFQVISGSFYYDGTANSIVFRIYTGTASWNAQWDSFTLSTYSAVINRPITSALTVSGQMTINNNSVLHSAGDNSYTKYGQSSSYPGYYLAVGETPDVGSASIAQVIATNGNLFLDASNNQSIYYGNYQTSRGGTGQHQFYGKGYFNDNVSLAGRLGIGTVITPTYDIDVARSASGGVYCQIKNADSSSFSAITLATDSASTGAIFKNGSIRSTDGGVNTMTMRNNDGDLRLLNNGTATITLSGSNTITGNRFLGSVDGSNNFWVGLTGTGTEANRLGIGINGNATTGVVSSIVMNVGGTRQLNLNNDGKVYIERNELVVNGTLNSGTGFYGQYRMVQGNYGVFLRNDGSNTLFLITNSGDQYGQWNSLRPLYINNASGRVYMENGLTLNNVANNTSQYSHVLSLNGTTVERAQCLHRSIYGNNSIGWGGGLNTTYAFYKYSAYACVRLSGKISGYVTGVGTAQYYIRIYSQQSGIYRYYYFNKFFNITSNHEQHPLELCIFYNDLPETGWFDVFVANSSAYITDVNDQLYITATVLPANAF